MNVTQQTIHSLLEVIVVEHPEYYLIQPADEVDLRTFERRAITSGVPTEVIRQLLDFYQIANAFYYELCLGFFSCKDEVIFEWWDSGKELWLSLMHMDVIRWSAGKFCVGDASSVSYSSSDEYETLVDLLIGCSNYIKEVENAEPEDFESS
jgi:hypothetical protein